MTNEERIQAVIDCGFTERQARFLVLVMRHAGVCIPRQYAQFAGIANGGRRCNLFFDRLVTRRYAHEIRCVHNRARVYHVRHKQLYFMIGEGASRHRRPMSPRLAMERLMLLDAVLAIRDVDWLTTAEKAAYLERLRGDTGAGVRKTASVDDVSATNSESPSALPIGLAPDGRVVLVYLASEPATERFRTFLQTHAALLRVAPSWTLRLVFPRPLDHVYGAYQAVIHEELESPLHPATIREVLWYFEHRANDAQERMHTQVQGLLERGATVFGASRFTTMYQRWKKHGNAVFEGMSSPAIAEALSTGRGRVETVVLRYAYRHLFPLVADTPSRPQPTDTGLRRETTRGPMRPRVLNPCPQPPRESSTATVPDRMDLDWRRLVEAHKAQKTPGVTT